MTRRRVYAAVRATAPRVMDDLVQFQQGGGDGVIYARNWLTEVSRVTEKTEPKVACEGRLSVRI